MDNDKDNVYVFPSNYGTITASQLEKCGRNVGIRPTYIDEIKVEGSVLRYIIKFDFVKSDDLKSDDSVLSKYNNMQLSDIEFSEFKSAYDASHNGVVVYNKINSAYGFMPARGFSMYKVNLVELEQPKPKSWIQSLIDLPNDIKQAMLDLRMVISSMRLHTTEHKIVFDREIVPGLKRQIDNLLHECNKLQRQMSHERHDFNNLNDCIQRELDGANAKVLSLTSDILKLENQLSKQDEDVLVSAERIKARILIEAKQKQV